MHLKPDIFLDIYPNEIYFLSIVQICLSSIATLCAEVSFDSLLWDLCVQIACLISIWFWRLLQQCSNQQDLSYQYFVQNAKTYLKKTPKTPKIITTTPSKRTHPQIKQQFTTNKFFLKVSCIFHCISKKAVLYH